MNAQRGWGSQAKASNLVLARMYVRIHAPYLSSTLFGLIPTPTPGLIQRAGGPLAVTERLVMYYEPEWVEQEEVPILATGLAHEILHVQLKHIARGRSYPDKKRWNRAGDLFINGSLRAVVRTKRDGSKIPLWIFPDWAIMPSHYGFPEGLTADAYYRLLEDFEKSGKKPQGAGVPSWAASSDEDSDHLMGGCCGGVAGNALHEPAEQELNHEKGRSTSNVTAIAKATAKAIQSHMNSIEGRGSLPGSWSEFVEISDKKFDVPWRTKLSVITRLALSRAKVGGLDYSRKRPSKRSYLRGVTLPGLIGYDPEVWFIVDSSGSMGQEQLADASKVCSDVLTQTGITHAWWMEADTEHKREPLHIAVRNLQHMEIRGRGGTDFSPAIAYVSKRRPKPQIVIYITDGCGPAPATAPPGIHFIWVIVPSTWAAIPARWGDMVLLTDHLPPMYPGLE